MRKKYIEDFEEKNICLIGIIEYYEWNDMMLLIEKYFFRLNKYLSL